MPRIKVTQIRSKVRNPPEQRDTLRSLGLKRIGDVVVKEDRPCHVSLGGEVTVEDLVKKGAARKGHPVKVLGNGEISVKVSVSAHAFSSAATEKITSAGGSAKTL